MLSSRNNSPPSARITRWASRARTLAVMYWGLLFVATHIPMGGQPHPQVSDKAIHFAAYFIWTFLFLGVWEISIQGMGSKGLAPKHFFAVWLAGTLYGAFDELTQAPVGRSCDIHDWLADVGGILCAMVVFDVGRAACRRWTGTTQLEAPCTQT